jgi:beta-1,4-mannosyltransferase
MNIYLYPNDSGANQYINLHKGNLRKIDGVKLISRKKLISFSGLLSRSQNVIVINWFENRGFEKNINVFSEFFVSFFILLLFRIFSSRLIWIKHNFRPHNSSKKLISRIYIKYIDFLLKLFCDLRLAHRPINGFEYFPHPLYPFNIPCDELLNPSNKHFDVINDADFLIFGNISNYKGVENLLNEWPDDIALNIIGKSTSESLTLIIENIIKSRGLKVYWHNDYVSENVLTSILINSKYVVLSHIENSMIVSGAFFHSISFGLNVIIKDGDFSDYISGQHSFVNIYKTGELHNVLHDLEYIPMKTVIDEAEYRYGNNVILDAWVKVLMK